MKTLMKLLLLTSLATLLSLTSCNKDDPAEVNADNSAPNSSDSSIDVLSKNKDFEIVDFDGFVNISAPISEGVEDASNEGVVITESGIEMPVFGVSESAVIKEPIQKGEQGRAHQSTTAP